ncbi:MAG TPA: glycoside hydrolase family 2, partial [Chitinophagaceae bacterium]|nr:glycoside hydrolase family 2 [Chitinophagaceae bacterium]
MFFRKISLTLIFSACILFAFTQTRSTLNFNKGWKFKSGDDSAAKNVSYNDADWRTLNLPHDWSIEFSFDSTSPTGNGGGALRGGLAWYRKTFTIS